MHKCSIQQGNKVLKPKSVCLEYLSDGFYRQVNQISGAHNTLDKQTPSKPKKKQNSKGLAPSVVRFYSCVHMCRS